jgi:hypothetical protein
VPSEIPLNSATDEKGLSAESFGESFGSDVRQARDDASMIMILCNNCSHYSMNSQTCINDRRGIRFDRGASEQFGSAILLRLGDHMVETSTSSLSFRSSELSQPI